MPGRLALSALALVALALTAFASVVLEVGVERLADRADLVVRGTVTEKSVLLERGGKQIWTRYRVRVDETLAGETAKSVLVHAPGGRVGDRSQFVHGAARAWKGDEVVAFLWKDRAGRRRVLGQAQGLYRVVRDKATGERVCRSRLDGLVLVGADGKKRPGEGRKDDVALDEMKRRVAAVRAAKKAREEAARREKERRRLEKARRAKELHERTRGQPGSSK